MVRRVVFYRFKYNNCTKHASPVSVSILRVRARPAPFRPTAPLAPARYSAPSRYSSLTRAHARNVAVSNESAG